MNGQILRSLKETILFEHPTYIGGGTDIMPLLKNGVRDDCELVFLKKIPELRELTDAESYLVIGSGMTLTELAENKLGNVKKCAVGKHPKSEKHGNTAQISEVERSGTQENCGGIGSGCRLHQRPLPVLRRRQSQRVARIDPNAVVVDKNIAENDRFDLFSR